jgi:hypothetical protein
LTVASAGRPFAGEYTSLLKAMESTEIRDAPPKTGAGEVPEARPGATAEKPDSTEAADGKEAMEIGGLVTVDASFDPKVAGSGRGEIGEVDLSANVNVAEGVTASITVAAEGNMSALSIDQALVQAEATSAPFTFLFGQQTFNFGLLSTRLISDPSILDDVETKGPGVVVAYRNGAFSPGIAATFVHNDAVALPVYRLDLADTSVTVEDSVVSGEKNLFEGIANLDIAVTESWTGRIAVRFLDDIIDVTVGAGIVCGPVLVDVEAYGEVNGDAGPKKGGYYTGLAYGLTERLKLAARYDGVSANSFRDISHRIGMGANVGFNHGLFCAIEYSIDGVGRENPRGEIAFQAGLESTIKLPGFQRKTLTKK